MDTLSPKKRYCKVRKKKTRRYLNRLRTTLQNNKNNSAQESNNKIIGNRKNSDSLKNIQTNNITDKRITLKYGIFANGARSETITRLNLSEEFRARAEEDLYKIIDLANGSPKKLNKHSSNETEQLTDETRHDTTSKEAHLYLNDTCNYNINKMENSNYNNIKNNKRNYSTLKDSTVGHISPIKTLKLTKNEERHSHIDESKICTTLDDMSTINNYKRCYINFSEHINNEMLKYLPLHTDSLGSDIKKELKKKYEENNKINGHKTQIVSKHSNYASRGHENEPEVLLNAIEYLKRAGEQANVDEDGHKSLFSRSRKQQMEETKPSQEDRESFKQYEYNRKHFKSPRDSYFRSSQHERERFKESQERGNFKSQNEVAEIDSSSDENTERSIYDVQINMPVLDTPEPTFFPRRINF